MIDLKLNTISYKVKFMRLLWGAVWTLFARFSPRPLHFWRAFLLRLFGAKIGRNVHVYPSAKIWAPWNLIMHDHSCLGEFVDCYTVDNVTIGARSTVSQYSFLCTASHDYSTRSMPLITAPIVIGDDVWITADVFVAPGVLIDDGCVVLSRSSVYSDLDSWTVCIGNPARAVKQRVIVR